MNALPRMDAAEKATKPADPSKHWRRSLSGRITPTV